MKFNTEIMNLGSLKFNLELRDINGDFTALAS
jgi:hypothetical protein